MKIEVFVFGKLKTPGLQDTCAYYEKRLRGWVKTEVIEQKSIRIPDKSTAEQRKVLEHEASLIEKQLNRKGTVPYLLDERAPALSSLSWADRVRSWETSGSQRICFFLGGSLGFHQSIREKVNQSIGLGPQTLSHELSRVVLLEQLYRAWSLVRGHPYHNAGIQ